MAKLQFCRTGDLVGGKTLELLLTGIGGDQTQTQDGGNGKSD